MNSSLTLSSSFSSSVDTPRPVATPEPANENVRIIADPSLHRVARGLRLLGVDCLCDVQYGRDVAKIFELAKTEARVILTTSTALVDQIVAENSAAQRGRAAAKSRPYLHKYFLVKGSRFPERMQHVARHFNVVFTHRRFTPRCEDCNIPIERIDRAAAQPHVEEAVFRLHHEYWQCPACKVVRYALRERAAQTLHKVDVHRDPMSPLALRVVPAPAVHGSLDRSRPSGSWRIVELSSNLLPYLTVRDVFSLMRVSKPLLHACSDNVHWRARFESRMHTLDAPTIASLLGRQTLQRPFSRAGRMLPPTPELGEDVREEDGLVQEPEGFWMASYRDAFRR